MPDLSKSLPKDADLTSLKKRHCTFGEQIEQSNKPHSHYQSATHVDELFWILLYNRIYPDSTILKSSSVMLRSAMSCVSRYSPHVRVTRMGDMLSSSKESKNSWKNRALAHTSPKHLLDTVVFSMSKKINCILGSHRFGCMVTFAECPFRSFLVLECLVNVFAMMFRCQNCWSLLSHPHLSHPSPCLFFSFRPCWECSKVGYAWDPWKVKNVSHFQELAIPRMNGHLSNSNCLF